ncbi:MAG: bifunctional DNA-formamidopyrimidine glycosylase/DNA-(apurinic or apyrimidinic site) lyase [Chloroflexi bacterium]|nr:bifunctional DNA-formamidopyrimidine glycosylase/DNA-(apurinic or apyrimidinic site) lyase [Chloroflexota bacterium]
MPELPEVETLVRRLRPALVGQRIERAEVRWARTIAEPSVETFKRRVRDQTFVAVERRAKYLLFRLSGGDTLAAHLRMTGDFALCSSDTPRDPYERVRFHLSNGGVGQVDPKGFKNPSGLLFTDTRKFGRITLTREPDALLGHLGPEPLARAFTPLVLQKILQDRAAPIKPFLLNQEHIAGLGNIYADEALHYAGVHPQRPAGSLSADEIRQLHEGIRAVLRKGIRLGGSTLSDGRFRDPFGRPGRMQNEFVVYHDPRRKQKTCPRCGTRIAQMVIAQRSAHFCPGCQR